MIPQARTVGPAVTEQAVAASIMMPFVSLTPAGFRMYGASSVEAAADGPAVLNCESNSSASGILRTASEISATSD